MNMYDEDYFLRGKQTGQSLYEDYRWLPDLTIPMVRSVIDYLGIEEMDSILDFGAARGYTVKAFRQMGYDCYGTDTSQWAVENCDPEVKMYMRWTHRVITADWIIAKDVLEHVENLTEVVASMQKVARKGVFVVVPLALSGTYVVPDYEKDITHIHRFDLPTWISMFMQPSWEVTASYRVPGVKDNYDNYEYGNGFITARRLCRQ